MRRESDRLVRVENQERQIKEMEDQEYSRRENNNGQGRAAGIIPNVVPQMRQEEQNYSAAGVVATTDSESEYEAGNKNIVPFKWTTEWEDKLEELLTKNYFDFHATAKEFNRLVNQNESENYYQIDSKTLQLRWTDIEIRRYRLNQNQGKSEADKL